MKRRKVLLVVFLLIAIILQSVVPFTVVHASTSVEITLNSNLYKAVKSQLEQQKISASYIDANRKIIIDQSEIDKVTYLDLSNSEIDDLKNLSSFSKVETLNLTANELTKDSNLDEISKLSNLKKLNLSSNKIESVSSITNFDSIEYTDITNQELYIREVITVDTDDQSDQPSTIKVTLPDILLKDKNMIDADWISYSSAPASYRVSGPVVNWTSVKSGSTEVELTIGSGKGEQYTPYKGLLTITIDVKDSNSKLANTKMKLYYVVIDSDHTGIIFDDENLYKAVRDQLSAYQTINDELESYGYYSAGPLYEVAYDAPMILVIKTFNLTYKIPSLVLNDKKIVDLRGLEQFIGLKSNLNLSYNYIDTIKRIIELEENKEAKEKEIQEKIASELGKLSEYRSSYENVRNSLKEVEEEIKDTEEEISDEYAKILSGKLQDETELRNLQDKYNQLQEKKAGYEEDLNHNDNLFDLSLRKLYKIYPYVYRLTSILPVKVIKLSSSDLNSLNFEEAKTYAESIMDRISSLEKDNALTDLETDLLVEEFSIETVKSLDGYFVDGEYSSEEEGEIENPITTYFDKVKEKSDYNTLATYLNIIKKCKEIENYSLINNYCIIERYINSKTECYVEDAIEDIYEFNSEYGYDTSYIEAIRSIYNNQGKLAKLEKTEMDDEGNIYTIKYCEGSLSNASDVTKREIYKVSGKLIKAISEEIEAFVKLPRIQKLNLEDNKISNLKGLEVLKELKELNVYKNILGTIENVDWSSFKMLKLLNLGYNQLSNIKPLETLTTIEYLYLNKNLLSGSYDFYLADKNNLRVIDFSSNQYSDISYLINQFKFIAKAKGMSAEEYLSSYYSPTISFQNQSLSLSTTVVKDGDFVTIDLPKIFSQFEQVSTTKTSYGIDSQNGTVLADGTGVVLRTPTTGKYTAIVSVEGHNGNATNNYSTSGIGYGTICTIDYTVVDSTTTNDSITQTPSDNTNTQEQNDNSENQTQSGTSTSAGDSVKPEYGYKVLNGYVYVSKPETTLKEFAEKIVDTTKYNVKVVNPKNVIDVIATGAVVSIETKDGNDVEILEVVVKGDVNGDGEVDALDSGIIRNVISDTTALVGVYKAAADVNNDGDIDSLDSLQVLKYRADKISSFED